MINIVPYLLNNKPITLFFVVGFFILIKEGINMNKVKPSIAKKFIEKCLVNKLPVFIKSSPGCGKSSLIRDLAEEFNLKLIDHRLSTSDITDLNN